MFYNAEHVLLIPVAQPSLHVVSLGPWTPPPPRRLIRTPFGPLSMYVCFTDAVHALLTSVAQPTVCVCRPLAL
jgi:hypothetical protein